MGVRIVQKSTLKHLISAWLNTWHKVRWRESNLLRFCMVVLWISIKCDLTHWNQRIIRVWPNLCNIKDVKSVIRCVFLRHCLNKPVPGWIVSIFNRIPQIVCWVLRVLYTLCTCLSCSKVFDSLASLIMILHVVNVTFVINPSESMRWVSIHMTIAVRSSTVTEENGNLM